MSPASALKNMLPVALLLLSGVVSTSANANGNVNPLPDFCGRDYVVALDTNTGSGSITNPETQLVVNWDGLYTIQFLCEEVLTVELSGTPGLEYTLPISSTDPSTDAVLQQTGKLLPSANPLMFEHDSGIFDPVGGFLLCVPAHSGGGGGDPHFKTWSHEKFDFHGACDLVLLNNPTFGNGLGMDIHIRTKIRFSWSYIETATLRIGQDTLEIMGGDLRRYWINGVFGSSGKEFPANIGGYIVDYVKEGTGPSKQRIYTVSLGNAGERIILKTYKDFVSVDLKATSDESFADSVGLMGSYRTGHKIARDGETVMSDPIAFGQEWQVLITEPKLFHSLEGPQQPLQQCEMLAKRRLRKNKDKKAKKRLGHPEVEEMTGVTISQTTAEAACRRVKGEDHDLCVFDVMATNDMDMAGAY